MMDTELLSCVDFIGCIWKSDMTASFFSKRQYLQQISIIIIILCNYLNLGKIPGANQKRERTLSVLILGGGGVRGTTKSAVSNVGSGGGGREAWGEAGW